VPQCPIAGDTTAVKQASGSARTHTSLGDRSFTVAASHLRNNLYMYFSTDVILTYSLGVSPVTEEALYY